jgi:predicted membrane channel-forming protein YqfA (hemolysin III family)
MWEEHPAYQKAQAKMIGVLVLVTFIASIIYCVFEQDWDALRLVIYAGGGLVAALALLPLVAWLIVKTVAWIRAKPSKPPSSP